ncbi:hypothetical protein RR42_m3248 [Cupriavidus basilensis]|uniref:Uncharacterized protein n=1 Tax=Cupriavidus basilensis TaxID=68895 RepID=A0A0C4YIV8_9BURK|nr:hypothetical protein RR42_m3248 [Cupriavidus basilensis]
MARGFVPLGRHVARRSGLARGPGVSRNTATRALYAIRSSAV